MINTSTLSQAREGITPAVRMVSVRAALPLFGIQSWGDTTTYFAISGILIIIFYIIRADSRRSRRNEQHSLTELSEEREVLEERIAERTKDFIRAETERLHEIERSVRFGELAKGLFHDLMTPLSAISMYVEKLEPAKRDHEVVSKVVNISKRMNSFMESVRHSMGAPSPKDSTAFLREELGIIRDILGYKAKIAEVTLTISECPLISFPIHPVRLHQLLSNIISNAIEACIEDRKIQGDRKDYFINVDIIKTNEDVQITIRDNGCGMSAEKRGTLFNSPSTSKPAGLGIGLVTVKKIIENELRGSIVVESELGRGSIFTITVPTSSL